MSSEPYILAIETSQGISSVALSKGEDILGIIITQEKNKTADKINLMIDEVLQSGNLKYTDLNCISVSGGPGSYTGLRIGVATAKGLAYALDIPLIHIETFIAMKVELESINSDIFDYYVPMQDARRKDAFLSVIDSNNEYLLNPTCMTIDEHTLEQWSSKGRVVIMGNRLDKFQFLAQHSTVVIVNNLQLTAASLINLTYKKYRQNNFEDLAYYEPKYYKNFYTAKN